MSTCPRSGVAVYPAVTLLQGHYIEDRHPMMGTASPYPGMARSMYDPLDPRETCAGRYSGFGQRWPYMYGMLEVRGDVLRVLNHPPISPKAELSRRRLIGSPSRMAKPWAYDWGRHPAYHKARVEIRNL